MSFNRDAPQRNNLNTDDHEDSSFIGHEPCSACGSRDNLSRYTDGHGYCHGCKHYEHGDTPSEYGSRQSEYQSGGQALGQGGFTPADYEISAIPKRGLTATTCRFWSYGVGTFGSGGAHFANYFTDDRTLIAQKVRTPDKDFPVLKASGSKLPLYGQWLWKNDRRSLVITEGELDALSVSQAQDNKYPVVSLPLGPQRPQEHQGSLRVDLFIR
ncbi:hypothetical protein [Sphingomonas paeninsulae]|uniref:hypothetical protein n=1 Tax=Sphingomonas paeninsulae TaxID=2319844 RepID=UPI003D3500A9